MIHDAHVSVSSLMGANRAYVESRIPHLQTRMAQTAAEVAAHAEVCVVGTSSDEVLAALAATPDSVIIDLVRFPGSEALAGESRYRGVCW